MKRIRYHIAVLAVLCTASTPAMAGLFGFSYSNLHTVFDGTDSFQTTHSASSVGSVYRNSAPEGTAVFLGPPLASWDTGYEGFRIDMQINNITATTAEGSGTFSIKDVDGDEIAGNLIGTWMKLNGNGVFNGSITNVEYTDNVNDTFDGHLGTSMSMVFDTPAPWSGTLLQLTASGGWFTDQYGNAREFDVTGGSIDAHVPVPAAAFLGILGLSAAGVKLRRFA